jgi:hypothetical protein
LIFKDAFRAKARIDMRRVLLGSTGSETTRAVSFGRYRKQRKKQTDIFAVLPLPVSFFSVSNRFNTFNMRSSEKPASLEIARAPVRSAALVFPVYGKLVGNIAKGFNGNGNLRMDLAVVNVYPTLCAQFLGIICKRSNQRNWPLASCKQETVQDRAKHKIVRFRSITKRNPFLKTQQRL